MANDGGGIGIELGNQPNFVRQGLADKRARLREIGERVSTCEVVLVHDYHADTQTVDVRIKADPNVPIIYGVPIADGLTGGLRVIGGFRTVVAGDVDPTVGLIVYPRLDSSLTNLDHTLRDAPSLRRHRDSFGFFVACVPVVPIDGSPATVAEDVSANSDALGPRDVALFHRSGSFIMFKENGDVVIKAQGNVYVGGTDQSVADMDGATRQGDTGDGGLGAGPIAGGSSRVFIGD